MARILAWDHLVGLGLGLAPDLLHALRRLVQFHLQNERESSLLTPYWSESTLSS